MINTIPVIDPRNKGNICPTEVFDHMLNKWENDLTI